MDTDKAAQEENQKAKRRDAARQVYPDVVKMEKYLEFLVEHEKLLSHPRVREQMRRARDAIYTLRVCLHYECCKY